MISWKNFDELSSYKKLEALKGSADLKAAMSGEAGGERVAKYCAPMVRATSRQKSCRKNLPAIIS